MKKKKPLYIILFLLIASGITMFFVLEKKPKYLPCPVLKDGETMDVILLPSLYASNSASYTVMYVKWHEQCVDAWLNEDGMPVVRYDRETLKQEYERVYDILMREVNNSENDKIKMKVSYDYSELYMYISDGADIENFAWSGMVAPRACLNLRLLQGLSPEEATVEVIYIYEPNGKELLRIDEKTHDFHMNQEQWEKLLEEARQG